jgi:uncharacterized SAM-binding protein YcdF (DUF218 family)
MGRLVLWAVVAWLAGLAWFTLDALRGSSPRGAGDGIVALTGDADRVETGLALLRQGHGRILLISGAGPRFSLAELARRSGDDEAWLAARVTLGRQAVSTRGNGVEFADWAARNQIGSAVVVTSYYHMRRAMLELSRAAPGVRLIPRKVPLRPWLRVRDARKVIDDYDKYLLALMGLSRFSPGHASA